MANYKECTDEQLTWLLKSANDMAIFVQAEIERRSKSQAYRLTLSPGDNGQSKPVHKQLKYFRLLAQQTNSSVPRLDAQIQRDYDAAQIDWCISLMEKGMRIQIK